MLFASSFSSSNKKKKESFKVSCLPKHFYSIFIFLLSSILLAVNCRNGKALLRKKNQLYSLLAVSLSLGAGAGVHSKVHALTNPDIYNKAVYIIF